MWLKEKIINGKRCVFLRPEKVEYIRIVDYPMGQGDGAMFTIGIDGVEYISCQKLNVPPYCGLCFLDSPQHEHFYCDDSIIIAALCRFFFTYQFSKLPWPERDTKLPLLPRDLSRTYLKWHLIPHPGEGW